MRKKWGKCILCFLFILLGIYLYYLQFGREVQIINSVKMGYSDSYHITLTVVANKLFLQEDEAAAILYEICMEYADSGPCGGIDIYLYKNQFARRNIKLYCVAKFDSEDWRNNTQENKDSFVFQILPAPW